MRVLLRFLAFLILTCQTCPLKGLYAVYLFFLYNLNGPNFGRAISKFTGLIIATFSQIATCIHPSIHALIAQMGRRGQQQHCQSSRSILFKWTVAGSVHPHQSMMSSTHRLGGRPLVLSPSTMPSITVFTSLLSSILHNVRTTV